MNTPYQCQSNECPFKRYCNDDCDACSDKIKAEKVGRVVDRVVEVLQPIVSNIIEVLTTEIQETVKTINSMWYSVIECYPNRRVVYLALYHPKKKVRKKNIQRIMRWIHNK